MDNRPGIYLLTFANGSRYVGSSIHVRRRVLRHLNDLRQGRHSNGKLLRAFFKHGAPKVRTLLNCAEAHLLLYEQLAIESLKPGLNCAPIAGRNTGHRHSAETLARMREAGRTAWQRRVRHVGAEQRARISASLKGRVFSLETKAKISRAKAGHEVTAETRARLSLAKRGRPLSPEVLARRLERLAATKTAVVGG